MIDKSPIEKEPLTIDQIILAHVEWSGFVIMVAALSVVNLLLLALPLPSDARWVIVIFNVVVALILWGDFFHLLRLVPNKRSFMREDWGWMVLISSFPALGILRLLWFRLVLKAHGRTPRDFVSEIAFQRNATATVLSVLFAVLVVFEFSVAMILLFEGPTEGSNIKTISDGFWWAFVTIATVGYGDRYPVTNGGRFIGVMLMVVGIALFSVATSGLAGWFRSRPIRTHIEVKAAHDEERRDHITEIKELLEAQEARYQTLLHSHEENYQQKIAELHSRLSTLEANGNDTPAAMQGRVDTHESSQ